MNKNPEKSPPKSLKMPKNIHQVTIYVLFLLFWAGISLIASQFILALPLVALLGNKANTPLWTSIYQALVYILTLALVLFVPPRLARLYQKRKAPRPSQHPTPTHASATDLDLNPKELGLGAWPTFVDIGLAPIGYVVHLTFAALLTTLMSVFTWFNADQVQDTGYSYFISGGDRIVAMLALVFVAPIAEEIIMRGWLYGKLRTKLNFPVATLCTSLLFALLHGQWNVGVTVFSLSLVLCSLREITGTIWSGVLLHILNNGVAFYLLYIAI